MGAIGAHGVVVTVGETFNDIDEPADLLAMVERAEQARASERLAETSSEAPCPCPATMAALGRVIGDTSSLSGAGSLSGTSLSGSMRQLIRAQAQGGADADADVEQDGRPCVGKMTSPPQSPPPGRDDTSSLSSSAAAAAAAAGWHARNEPLPAATTARPGPLAARAWMALRVYLVALAICEGAVGLRLLGGGLRLDQVCGLWQRACVTVARS